MIRKYLIIVTLLSGFLTASGRADDPVPQVRLEYLSNLVVDARLMETARFPMVIEMAAEDCTYCLLIEEEVLRPMILSGDYRNKILLRKVDIHMYDQILDFDGNKVSQRDFAQRYKVNLTPTVLFLDHKGNEVAPRMVGVPMIDFYGLYLDDSIERAREVVSGAD